MLPATHQRVPAHTEDQINQQIRLETQQRIERYRGASEQAITQRLKELDQEWDTERTLETNAASLAFAGCILAATVDRRWVLLPLAVSGFLLQHAIQGWCPPLPVIRRLGVRTMREIDEERTAMKALRGDFNSLTATDRASTAEEILQAVER